MHAFRFRGCFAACAFLAAALTSAAAGSVEQRTREAWVAVPDARGVQLVHVECGARVFDPLEIVVEQGVPVELSVRSSDTDQEFVSGFTARARAGRVPTLHRFTPAALGHFEMACEQGGGAATGARNRRAGILTVVPRGGS